MPTLVTTDIWDTILRRRCHPDEVKLATARFLWLWKNADLRAAFNSPRVLMEARVRAEHEIATANRARGLDDEYRVEEVMERWACEALRRESMPHGPAEIAAELVAFEFERECEVCYADDMLPRVLADLKADRVVALSDFYMGGPLMRRLLSLRAPGVEINDVVVSCDPYLNKRSGRLFSHLHRELAGVPSTHVHVGDNPHSDVAAAASLGVRAVHFINPREEALRAAHNSRYRGRMDSGRADVSSLSRDLADRFTPPDVFNARERALYAMGVRLAPFFAGFILAAMEESWKRGVGTIHYCTREGEFFAAIHRAMGGACPDGRLLGLAVPADCVIEVSRLATFFPSLREVTPREFMRVWNLYSTQSIGQMLATLGVDRFAAEPLLARHAIDPVVPIKYPWQDPRVVSLLSDPVFVRLLERQRNRRRGTLLGYLESRGIRRGDRAHVLVDIGWRGTIQDNLAYILPGTHLAGVYLGMQRPLNEQPESTSKIAFGPDMRSDEPLTASLLSDVAVLEMLCNAPGGSVVGYSQSNGVPVAIRESNAGEDAVHEAHTRFFQAGVLDAIPAVTRWIALRGACASEMRPCCLGLIRDALTHPTREVADAFFSLRHNETFGVGGFHDLRSSLPSSLLRGALSGNDGWMKLKEHARRSRWPQGFFVHFGLPDLLERFNDERRRELRTPGPQWIESKAMLDELIGSRAWRVVECIKRTPLYRAAARLKYNESELHKAAATSPAEEIGRIRASRAYRVITELKNTGVYRAIRGRRAGGSERQGLGG
ncbi:MAG: hypothetical protein IT432_08930 [Phycisphaerales bacterium]|nr:hypothetical protein [Phycisphaerales bacterium]